MHNCSLFLQTMTTLFFNYDIILFVTLTQILPLNRFTHNTGYLHLYLIYSFYMFLNVLKSHGKTKN